MPLMEAAQWDDLLNGEMMGCQLGGNKVLIIKIDDRIFAYEDRCAHFGMPLSQGKLDEQTLTCFAHEWQYDVCSGKGINPQSVCLRQYAVLVTTEESILIWKLFHVDK